MLNVCTQTLACFTYTQSNKQTKGLIQHSCDDCGYENRSEYWLFHVHSFNVFFSEGWDSKWHSCREGSSRRKCIRDKCNSIWCPGNYHLTQHEACSYDCCLSPAPAPTHKADHSGNMHGPHLHHSKLIIGIIFINSVTIKIL